MNYHELQRQIGNLKLLEAERHEMAIEEMRSYVKGFVAIVLLLVVASFLFGLMVSLATPAHGAPIVLDGFTSVNHQAGRGRIGVEVDRYTGRIRKVHATSPAARAGLQRGDVVVEVDGLAYGKVDIEGWAHEEVLLKVRRQETITEFRIVRCPIRDISDEVESSAAPSEDDEYEPDYDSDSPTDS